MSNYEYLGKKEIYKMAASCRKNVCAFTRSRFFVTIKAGNILRVIIRDILYPFLACQKSSVQPLELSQVVRLRIRGMCTLTN